MINKKADSISCPLPKTIVSTILETILFVSSVLALVVILFVLRLVVVLAVLRLVVVIVVLRLIVVLVSAVVIVVRHDFHLTLR